MARNGKQVTRRSILQLSGGAFAVAGVAAISDPWPIVRFNRFRLQDVNAESFLPYVGKTLVFESSAGDQSFASPTAELRLAKVTPHENISRIESRNPAMIWEADSASHSLCSSNRRTANLWGLACTGWPTPISRISSCSSPRWVCPGKMARSILKPYLARGLP